MAGNKETQADKDRIAYNEAKDAGLDKKQLAVLEAQAKASKAAFDQTQVGQAVPWFWKR